MSKGGRVLCIYVLGRLSCVNDKNRGSSGLLRSDRRSSPIVV